MTDQQLTAAVTSRAARAIAEARADLPIPVYAYAPHNYSGVGLKMVFDDRFDPFAVRVTARSFDGGIFPTTPDGFAQLVDVILWQREHLLIPFLLDLLETANALAASVTAARRAHDQGPVIPLSSERDRLIALTTMGVLA